jgi:hypothetical protein
MVAHRGRHSRHRGRATADSGVMIGVRPLRLADRLLKIVTSCQPAPTIWRNTPWLHGWPGELARSPTMAAGLLKLIAITRAGGRDRQNRSASAAGRRDPLRAFCRFGVVSLSMARPALRGVGAHRLVASRSVALLGAALNFGPASARRPCACSANEATCWTDPREVRAGLTSEDVSAFVKPVTYSVAFAGGGSIEDRRLAVASRYAEPLTRSGTTRRK